MDDKYQDNTTCQYVPNTFPPNCSFIDVKLDSPKGRYGGANHKGVIDFWRRPKPAFLAVAALYNASHKQRRRAQAAAI